jgi:hypothetical protein
MPRSTKVETEQRIEQVYKMLLGGATFPDLREHARAPEQNWNVSDAQIRRYMTAAHQLIRERFEAKADYSFNRHMLRREQLFAHAMGAGDFGTALRVLQDAAKLEGLYPPTKIAPTNPTGDQPYDSITLTEAERLAAIENLRARVGTPDGGAPADRPDDAGGSLLGILPGGDDGRGPDAGPLAGGPFAEFPEESADPGESPEWQEPG